MHDKISPLSPTLMMKDNSNNICLMGIIGFYQKLSTIYIVTFLVDTLSPPSIASIG